MKIGIVEALESLRPGAEWILVGSDYSGVDWLDTKQSKPTAKEVEDEISSLIQLKPLRDCKAKAKELIAKSDWSVLTDVVLANAAAFEEYRAALRGYIVNPVVDPVWPVEPEPIWS